MTIDFHNPKNGNGAGTAAPGSAEETLRVIAGLPAPRGLEERVHRRLGAVHAQSGHAGRRPGRMLAWPLPRGAGGEWMRAAAAAAIAFVIAGGGWSVYRQVQPRQAGSEIRLAPHGTVPGGFAGAGAMRTPQTLNGPVLTHPVTHPADVHPAQTPSQMKPATKNVRQHAGRGAAAASGVKRSVAAKAGAPAAQP
jgi:hypothetical protein